MIDLLYQLDDDTQVMYTSTCRFPLATISSDVDNHFGCPKAKPADWETFGNQNYFAAASNTLDRRACSRGSESKAVTYMAQGRSSKVLIFLSFSGKLSSRVSPTPFTRENLGIHATGRIQAGEVSSCMISAVQLEVQLEHQKTIEMYLVTEGDARLYHYN